jgi:hypothetical protein
MATSAAASSNAPSAPWREHWQSLKIGHLIFYFSELDGDCFFLTSSLFALLDEKRNTLSHLLLPCTTDCLLGSAHALYKNEPSWTVGHILLRRLGSVLLPENFATDMLPPLHGGLKSTTVCLPAARSSVGGCREISPLKSHACSRISRVGRVARFYFGSFFVPRSVVFVRRFPVSTRVLIPFL